MAEYDKAMTVAKLRGARQRMRARGHRCERVRPFGHHAGEQKTPRYMRELRARGLNYTDITRQLNAEKIPARSGKPWQVMTVLNILKRETTLPTAT